MTYGLHSAYNLPADHDVCHLFEYLIIRRFLQSLKKSGGERAFIGSLDGTTAGSSVFFTSAFFNHKYDSLFAKIIADLTPFDGAMIHESIAHIEAEMKSSITIWSKPELRKQLAACQKAFANHRFTKLKRNTEPIKNPPLEIDYQPEDFIDIVLTIEVPDASDQTTAAFFCMYPLLLDLVRSACFDQAPVYPSSHGEFTAYQDGNATSQTYTIKKSFSWKTIDKAAQSYLRSFNAAPHASNLAHLAEAFISDPYYTAAPIYFYQKTMTPCTKDDLANAITVANLQAILTQAEVTITAAQ